MLSCPHMCTSWGSYCSIEDFWNIDMDAWVAANEQQLLDMMEWQLDCESSVELRVFFLYSLTLSFD